MKKILLLYVFTLLSISYAKAQEVCNDGEDNDGDGFIDCFDSDCSSNSACDGFYLGNDASCEAEPSAFPEFKLEEGYKSENYVTNNLSRIAIGDLDRDGIPEILSQNKNENHIYLLNGDDATIKHETTVSSPLWRASMANLEDDNCGEVFIVHYNSGYRISSYDCNLNLQWTSESLPNEPVHLGYADFDRDGQPEMYYKDEIRDPITGTRIVENSGDNWSDLPGGPIAVDVIGDDDLELVLGNKIYSVNLGDRSQDAGSLTLEKTMPGSYQVKYNGESASTSVADYNLDGYLDIIITGADNNNITTVFFWDVQNNTVDKFSDRIDENNYRDGWKNGTGRINIADLDGDGQLNAAFVSGKYLYALDENWNQLWRVSVNEETSGITGCTLFDFNGDGQSEVVYRDEDYLYIINGNDGSVNTQIHCRSRTNVEYPIVADVDADGSTEICVVCTPENFDTGTKGRNLDLDDPAEVRVYKSGGEPWVPARRLWNQHGYFNVNINDDLTVPQNQQKHHLVFSDSSACSSGPVRPLNSFLNQSPYLSSDGCLTFASPDLNIIESTFSVSPPNCPDEQFTVSFDFENIGDVAISGDVPITFYDGDPLVAGTNKLYTEIISLDKFGVGQVDSAVDIMVDGTGGQFTLYAVMNDDGSTTPTPISLPNSNFLECDYGNNIVSAEVNPVPFALSTEVTNNITCAAGSIPANGSARVFRLVGSTEVTTGYDFHWYKGTTTTGTADYIGATYGNLSAGTYTVFATDQSVGCSSDTTQVVIKDTVKTINANITVDRGNNDCKNPNGKLTVSLNGGEPVGNFTYEWYEGNTVGGGSQISNSQIANGLDSINYTVLVTEKATGCQTIESAKVPSEIENLEVTASATDIVCSDTNSGSVSASLAGGTTTGYTFEWFSGTSEKPTPDYKGSTVNNLPKGSYTVKVTNNDSNCESALVTVVINQTISPEIDTITSTENNSCDNSKPNGSVTVSIKGNVSEHTIEWFDGANTTTLIGTGSSLSNLDAGEYTAKVTNNNSGCFVTDRVTIVNNIVQPVLSVSADPVTSCSPYNGRIEATVDVDSESDYTFSWYVGNSVKTSPDFSETGSILENLEPGFYTVQAFHNTRNCLTDAVTIEVIDQAIIAITQNDNVINFPNTCNANDGVLEVTVNSPGNTSGFLLEWFNGTTATGTPFQSDSEINVSTASNLTSGIYTVMATDLDNGCSNSRTFDLPFKDAPDLITKTVTNATSCDPNDEGEITVELTPSTTPIDEGNYTIYLYSGNDINVAPIDTLDGATGKSEYTFDNLGDGDYIIEALSTPGLGNCSVYSFGEVELDATDPVVTASSIVANTNCVSPSVDGNGSIQIDIDNGQDPSDYTIDWYEGNDTTTPLSTGTIAGTNGELVTDLIGGKYTVEVMNDFTKCSTIQTFSLFDNPIVVNIPAAELDITNVTRCDINNGEATINNVYENGSAATLTDYTFEWFDASMNVLPNATSPNTTNSLNSLAVGSYFVRTKNANTGCESSLIEFSIESDIVEPTIALDFKNPERCISPSTGELRVSATAPSTTFSYDWYNGADTLGVVAKSGPDFLNLTAGFYTVKITDNTSNCIYTETYELVTEVNSVNLSTSATPVTNCDSPNGSVFATVTSPGNYSYNWTDASGNSVGTTKEITSLPAGEYTITATDNTDSFCQNTATMVVTNDQIEPPLVVEQIAPLSVCDLSKANGAAKAAVDGGFIGYTFEWFEGSSASGTIIHVGPEFSQMENITYTVRATNNITQCSNEESITITDETPAVKEPTIEILANDTNCQIDNGALRVDVGGNTGNYLFNWYRGDNANGTAFATGDRVIELSAGQYSVVATDLRTGCISATMTAEIFENLVYPELDIETQGANCGENNGAATVYISGDIEIDRIEWYNSFGTLVSRGPNLDGVPAENYTLRVETANGCFVEEKVNIQSEINSFNGISRNGDGSNSYFKIDCISQYPNNIVRIYNRAGTLVYEAKGYDNNSTKFGGVSNRGISVLGQNVPDGTYFYVIDKNDGSKPENGYLEIVN